MRGIPRDNVLRLYDEGVDAFAALSEELAPDAWARRACGTWTAADLARHVLAVAGWYHAWLDRAEHGDADPPFSATDLAAQNDQALRAMSGLEGPAAVEQFVQRAGTYRARVSLRWDLAYGYPRGTVTAGLHAGVAACEWHLHTWDLASAGGWPYRPSDPSALYAAAGACTSAAQGGMKGKLAGWLVPLGTRLRPWEALLRRSGRAPGPDD
jgi:hypothetical protein